MVTLRGQTFGAERVNADGTDAIVKSDLLVIAGQDFAKVAFDGDSIDIQAAGINETDVDETVAVDVARFDFDIERGVLEDAGSEIHFLELLS